MVNIECDNTGKVTLTATVSSDILNKPMSLDDAIQFITEGLGI